MTPETWTAVATVVIAIFTVVLALSGGVQAWLTRAAIKLGRDEFNATHRPDIIVHSISLIEGMFLPSGDPGPLGAEIMYFNKGDRSATVLSASAIIVLRNGPPPAGIVFTDVKVSKPEIASGEKGRFRIAGEIFMAEMPDRKLMGLDLYCLGQIIYGDGAGIRRETGFCRKLNPQNSRWEYEYEAEYEYSY